MRIKICGIRNEQDMNVAVNAGADAVGFLVGQLHASRDFILPGTAARLVRMLPPFVTPVLVTHFTDPAEVFDLVDRRGERIAAAVEGFIPWKSDMYHNGRRCPVF